MKAVVEVKDVVMLSVVALGLLALQLGILG
ncbi:MAG: hypothetical protein PWQ40_802 [Archaeoglobus sp.]|jgi:hypothetical protein|uniref:Uncharacterized protein n=2 Tax=Archaeoglobus fulgidus TaxID=2234 RepID=A0A075WHJ9_ARCFL|nr:hypothetical protein AFULGI_00025600 [Archaeoglobus fulgidus DSM 8774]KUJ93271.1 MAG: hypothetical protein XD40_1545 [Archaeoglobus fulgidus]KUK06911.1 MAG: hypothetical protein XD48_0843 [Archaeoglobus fulgidus]MDI3497433.1 hypothetical protein [Archaeoglobus sp.]